MQLQEAKEKFIEAWGGFGSNWGINRSMAQVHALLLVAEAPLSADDVMAELQISRGSSNMNLRALIDWGLVYKRLKAGERREYFVAEKDMWKVVRQIIIHRKKKELEPALKVLEDVQEIEGDSKEKEDFVAMIQAIELFSKKADGLLERLVDADSEWLMSVLLKMI